MFDSPERFGETQWQLGVGQELSHCYLTDAFSYGEMSYEGGQAKENVAYHGKMPTRDQFT